MDNVFVPYTYRETRAGIEAVSMPSELFRERKLFLIGEIDSTSMGVLIFGIRAESAEVKRAQMIMTMEKPHQIPRLNG